ncbi:MAG TPA: TadE family protein [Afipia sp.]
MAPLFFALIFAIMETAMVFFAGQVLETGTQDTARKLFTNQAQNSGWDQDKFRNDLCPRVSVLLDCAGIAFDVRSYPVGTPATISNPINGQGEFDSGNLTYSPPASNSSNLVVVRTFYQWPLFVTGLGYNLADIGRSGNNGKKLLTATAAFRIEPNGS